MLATGMSVYVTGAALCLPFFLSLALPLILGSQSHSLALTGKYPFLLQNHQLYTGPHLSPPHLDLFLHPSLIPLVLQHLTPSVTPAHTLAPSG